MDLCKQTDSHGRAAMTLPLRWIVTCSMFIMLVMAGPALVPAAAQETAVSFDIPAQPLPAALDAFAEQSHVQMLYKAETVGGLQSAPVSGQLTPAQALQNLLQGTGLSFQSGGSNTITVVKPAVGPSSAADPIAQDRSQAQKPMKVPEILVKDVKQRDNDTKSYVAEEAITATRTDTPIRDVPQSIQVITRKVIEEQRVLRLDEALQNVSGVITQAQSADVNDGFLIRGFPANNNNFFRDGLFDPFSALIASDPYNIQRLEVLKGPAAVLYGLGDPGGIINIVTRKPLPAAAYSAHVTFGNFNLYRPVLDAAGPLNASKTLFYRLNVVGQRADSFVDFARRDLVGVAPSVTWLMGPRTALTVQGEYFNRWSERIPGLPVEGTVLPNINGPIPLNRYVGFGDFDRNNRTTYRIGYDLTHQFDSNWSIRSAYRYTILEGEQVNGGILSLLPDQRTATRFLGGGSAETGIARNYGHDMVTNLVGNFRLWEMDHTLLTGVELREFRGQPISLIQRRGPSLNLDIFNPDYSINPLTAPIFGTNVFQSRQRLAGFFLQDQVTLLPNLKFVAGSRFDYVHLSNQFGAIASNPPVHTSDDTAISPKLGLVYQPIEPVSLYTTWMRGYLPNAPDSFNPGGGLFAPQRSTLYEVGMKTFFFQNRVSTNLAWYHLTREDVITPHPDPALAAQGFSVQTGEQRSQGIELDVTASLTAGWNAIASYAYTDAEVTADNNLALLHKRLGNVPYNKATLWSTYFFPEGSLTGFGLGGGVIGYTSRNASIFGPQVDIPGYVIVNSALYYNHDLQPGNWLGAKQMNVALNFRNLLDQRYVSHAFNSTTSFFFGEPRTVLATVGLQF